MANEIETLIGLLGKHNKYTKNLFDRLNASNPVDKDTKIPNHALEISTRIDNKTTTLYLHSDAFKKIQLLSDLAQKQSVYRQKNGKPDRAINFVCLGVQTFSGDLMIHDIGIPLFDYLKDEGRPIDANKPDESLFSMSIPKDVDSALLFDYFYEPLRTGTISFKNKEKALVALYGTTLPLKSGSDIEYQNSIPMSDILKASIRRNDITFEHPIVTGVLAITPKTLSQSMTGLNLEMGSLECVAIHYSRNKKGNVKPFDILNIANSAQLTPVPNKPDSYYKKAIKINSSHQPPHFLPVNTPEPSQM